MISRYCTAANIQDVQCSCHTFRHTFAKKYVMNGGDMFTLKSILRHKRIETTEMYVELFTRDLNIQHEKFSPIEHLAEELSSYRTEGSEGQAGLMSTKRWQNSLTSIENPSAVKKQLSFDELLQSFILDCKAKNLSPLTPRFYQDSAHRHTMAKF